MHICIQRKLIFISKLLISKNIVMTVCYDNFIRSDECIVNMTLLLVHPLLISETLFLRTSIEILLLGSDCISSLSFVYCRLIHCIF